MHNESLYEVRQDSRRRAMTAACAHPTLAGEITLEHGVACLPDLAVLCFDTELRFTAAAGGALATHLPAAGLLVGRRPSELGTEWTPLEGMLAQALAGAREATAWCAWSPGGEGDFEACAGPIRDRHGTIVGGVLSVRVRGCDDGEGIAVANLRREFDEVIEQSADVLTRHEHGSYTYVSPASRRVYGLEPEQMLGHSPFEFVHPDDAERVAGAVAAGLARGEGFQVEHRVRRPDGSCIWVEAAVRWNTSTHIGFGAVRDISSQKARESELRESIQRFEAAFEHAPIGMALTDLDGRWIKVNRALSQITGYSPEELFNRSFRDITHPDDIDADTAAFAALKSGQLPSYAVDKRYIHADGHVVWVALSTSVVRDEAGAAQYIVAQTRDITEQKQLKERLQHIADHDPLTGLYNRRRFEAALERQVRLSRRYEDCAALLLLDLDHFKYVNDSLGHTVGDRVIAHVGTLLSERLRDTDIVARLGGDEFAVLLPRVDERGARLIAEDIVAAVDSGIFMHDGHRYLLSASVGVVILNRDTASAEDALVSVDIALYDAKQRGRNRAAIYAPSTREDVLKGLTWSQRLRTALAGDGLELHAQPIVDLRTGKTVMHELLVRMRSGTGRLIPPSRFLAPAARFGYMPAVDRWVIGQAVRLAAANPDRSLTVNLAAKTIAEPGLVDYIVEQIAHTGADPARLMFELSEADVIANLDQARDTCERLRALGCGIALDDFGSGFSGFSYLKALQIDLLKIDGQFVHELATNELDRLVVRAILDVARGMAIPTVVEFVTDQAVAEQCRRLGATYGQGFHLGRPAPLSEIGTRTAACRDLSRLPSLPGSRSPASNARLLC